MKLEDKVAFWVDAGLTNYQELYDLQVKLADLRKNEKVPDVIITTEHHPEINFGRVENHNKFSESFLKEVEEKKGKNYTEKDVIDLLAERGIKFSRSKRGGGATYMGPGQMIFYPIVDHEKIRKRKLDVGGYEKAIDRILYGIISNFNIENLHIAEGNISTSLGERERRDVWTIKNEKPYKIGSKGLILEGKVAYHGFVVYAEKKGVDRFSLINSCGYKPEEVGIISIEEINGKQPNKEEIVQFAKNEIMKEFAYAQLREISYKALLELVKSKSFKG